MANEALRTFRWLHLYFGLLIAPALMFFAVSGALQTFSLHESVAGSSYKPPAWVAELAQIHKNQTTEIRKRPDGGHGAPDGGHAAAAKGDAGAKPADAFSGPTKREQHVPLKVFFVLVSVGLMVSTLTGIYMAYKYARRGWVVTVWLAVGVILPLMLLKL